MLAMSLSELIATRTASSLQCANGKPYVLLGYSAGARVAYLVAALAEKLGHPAAGIVLLDPIEEQQFTRRLFFDIQAASLKLASLLNGVSDSTLTASYWYHQICSTNMADEMAPKAPILDVRASQRMRHMKKAVEHSISNNGDLVHVPGDHISMLNNQETANVVDTWLSAL